MDNWRFLLSYTDSMQVKIQMMRAIGGEFAARQLKSSALALGIAAFIALVAVLWLTTLSAWWWLLATVVIAGLYC